MNLANGSADNFSISKSIDYVKTREETAKILRVSLRTLRRMEKSGTAPPRTRITERIHGYRDSEISKYLKRNTEPKKITNAERSTDSDFIDQIQAIRAKNNRAWMDIMRVAMKHAPKDTKALLREIQGNDLAISELNGRLGQE